VVSLVRPSGASFLCPFHLAKYAFGSAVVFPVRVVLLLWSMRGKFSHPKLELKLVFVLYDTGKWGENRELSHFLGWPVPVI